MRLKALALLLVLSTGLAGGAGQASTAKDSSGELGRYRGSVLVLLLGAPGCPGTQAATEFLAGYVKEAPEGVRVLRMDVPMPGGPGGPTPAAVGIPFKTDADRAVARMLDFFFYPTLYILDRDGEVRFSGACEPEKVRAIVAALLAEKPGDPKRSFTPPLLDRGVAAPQFSGKTPSGGEIGSGQLRGAKATLLFFGATDCPFSNEALAVLPGLVRDYGGRGAKVAVVTRSPPGPETAKLHEEKAPGIAVLCDPGDAVGKQLFHAPAVPFFYALDGQGKVAVRGPFTEPAARAALDDLLGVASTRPAAQPSGAG